MQKICKKSSKQSVKVIYVIIQFHIFKYFLYFKSLQQYEVYLVSGNCLNDLSFSYSYLIELTTSIYISPKKSSNLRKTLSTPAPYIYRHTKNRRALTLAGAMQCECEFYDAYLTGCIWNNTKNSVPETENMLCIPVHWLK